MQTSTLKRIIAGLGITNVALLAAVGVALCRVENPVDPVNANPRMAENAAAEPPAGIFRATAEAPTPELQQELDKLLSLKETFTELEIAAFGKKAFEAANHYSYANVQQAMSETRDYFTPDGWAAYQEAMKESGELETVLTRKLIVRPVIDSAEVVGMTTTRNGPAYQVRIKAKVIHEALSYSSQSLVDSTVTVVPVRAGTRVIVRGDEGRDIELPLYDLRIDGLVTT